MKPSGIVRRVDELGRVVLPIELRNTFGIKSRDSLEIFTDGDRIILKKYEPADVFTGEMEDLVEYMGKKVSRNNILELNKLAGIAVLENE